MWKKIEKKESEQVLETKGYRFKNVFHDVDKTYLTWVRYELTEEQYAFFSKYVKLCTDWPITKDKPCWCKDKK